MEVCRYVLKVREGDAKRLTQTIVELVSLKYDLPRCDPQEKGEDHD